MSCGYHLPPTSFADNEQCVKAHHLISIARRLLRNENRRSESTRVITAELHDRLGSSLCSANCTRNFINTSSEIDLDLKCDNLSDGLKISKTSPHMRNRQFVFSQFIKLALELRRGRRLKAIKKKCSEKLEAVNNVHESCELHQTYK